MPQDWKAHLVELSKAERYWLAVIALTGAVFLGALLKILAD